jgi:hypothetical protein
MVLLFSFSSTIRNLGKLAVTHPSKGSEVSWIGYVQHGKYAGANLSSSELRVRVDEYGKHDWEMKIIHCKFL